MDHPDCMNLSCNPCEDQLLVLNFQHLFLYLCVSASVSLSLSLCLCLCLSLSLSLSLSHTHTHTHTHTHNFTLPPDSNLSIFFTILERQSVSLLHPYPGSLTFRCLSFVEGWSLIRGLLLGGLCALSLFSTSQRLHISFLGLP